MLLLDAMVPLMLAFTGLGDLIRPLLGLDWFYDPRNSWIAVAVTVAIALFNVAMRRPKPPASA